MYVVDLSVQHQLPLAPFTTIGVGGPARYYLRATQPEAVEEAVAWTEDEGLPLLPMGRGSNLLVSDDGFPGLVLRVAISGVSVRRVDEAVELFVGAGENWSALVAYAVAQNWAGVECLAGIPGLVGATPVQNVGAYGQEVCESITHIEAYDTLARRSVSFTNQECAFSYRSSRFKLADHGRYIILGVGFRLLRNGPPRVHYIELERELAAWQLTRPTLQEVRRAVLEIRRRKSMLLHPHDPNARSAGSFFMNPLLSAEQIAALDEVITEQLPPGSHVPRFIAPGGGYKIPAAWLIERSGFTRGYPAGRVGLSSNHALAIVNHGGATARDVLALAYEIRNRVRERFGVRLTPEPVMVGLTWDE